MYYWRYSNLNGTPCALQYFFFLASYTQYITETTREPWTSKGSSSLASGAASTWKRCSLGSPAPLSCRLNKEKPNILRGGSNWIKNHIVIFCFSLFRLPSSWNSYPIEKNIISLASPGFPKLKKEKPNILRGVWSKLNRKYYFGIFCLSLFRLPSSWNIWFLFLASKQTTNYFLVNNWFFNGSDWF